MDSIPSRSASNVSHSISRYVSHFLRVQRPFVFGVFSTKGLQQFPVLPYGIDFCLLVCVSGLF